MSRTRPDSPSCSPSCWCRCGFRWLDRVGVIHVQPFSFGVGPAPSGCHRVLEDAVVGAVGGVVGHRLRGVATAAASLPRRLYMATARTPHVPSSRPGDESKRCGRTCCRRSSSPFAKILSCRCRSYPSICLRPRRRPGRCSRRWSPANRSRFPAAESRNRAYRSSRPLGATKMVLLALPRCLSASSSSVLVHLLVVPVRAVPRDDQLVRLGVVVVGRHAEDVPALLARGRDRDRDSRCCTCCSRWWAPCRSRRTSSSRRRRRCYRHRRRPYRGRRPTPCRPPRRPARRHPSDRRCPSIRPPPYRRSPSHRTRSCLARRSPDLRSRCRPSPWRHCRRCRSRCSRRCRSRCPAAAR